MTRASENPLIAAIYARKSNDDSDKGEAQSTVRQIERAREFAAARGWTVDDRFVWEDVGVSGAEFEKRAGLQALLAALEPTAPFQTLIISESSRLGRDTIRTLGTVQRITDAGVKIWSYLDGREIALDDEMDEVQAFIGSWAASAERRKAAQRVKDTLLKRAENGYVAGGKVFGYRNERPAPKAPVVRVINEAQATIVRRIFEMAAKGMGLVKIAKQLNAERADAPHGPVIEDERGKGGGWEATGVREVLHRDLYRGIAIYGRRKRERKRGTKTRTRTEASQWTRREMPDLRIVSEELWDAAQAAIAQSSAQFLRVHGKLAGQRENHPAKFKYLLSGFIVCAECNGPLVASKRGLAKVPSYICSAHKFRGTCANGTGVPIARLEATVIDSLQDTLSTENFVRVQRERAADEAGRASRQAERTNLLAEIPKLAADEQRIVRRIGLVEDDSLVGALKNEWAEVKAQREAAERRVAEIEGLERDLRAESDAIERVRTTWEGWRGVLNSDSILARQLLRKVLDGPIRVRRAGRGEWEFRGEGQFDGILLGSVGKRWNGGTSARLKNPQGSAWDGLVGRGKPDGQDTWRAP